MESVQEEDSGGTHLNLLQGHNPGVADRRPGLLGHHGDLRGRPHGVEATADVGLSVRGRDDLVEGAGVAEGAASAVVRALRVQGPDAVELLRHLFEPRVVGVHLRQRLDGATPVELLQVWRATEVRHRAERARHGHAPHPEGPVKRLRRQRSAGPNSSSESGGSSSGGHSKSDRSHLNRRIHRLRAIGHEVHHSVLLHLHQVLLRGRAHAHAGHELGGTGARDELRRPRSGDEAPRGHPGRRLRAANAPTQVVHGSLEVPKAPRVQFRLRRRRTCGARLWIFSGRVIIT
eukprot:scaffold630_cov218-Pinguiococcus_pyrenoidosus.AAC.8